MTKSIDTRPAIHPDCDTAAEISQMNAMPSASAAHRFIESNPETSASFLIEILKSSTEDSPTSNGRLRDIWKLAGGAVDQKNRAWIEVGLLPGLMRLLAAAPQPIAPVSGSIPENHVEDAMQAAWNGFCFDAECHPDCFEWRRGKMYARFSKGNFAKMVTGYLNNSLSTISHPSLESVAKAAKELAMEFTNSIPVENGIVCASRSAIFHGISAITVSDILERAAKDEK